MVEVRDIARSRFRSQFGIVREDPRWEQTFFADATGPVLCVASAGDTALVLAADHPHPVHVFDVNPDQLALMDRKRLALSSSVADRKQAFGVRSCVEAGADPAALDANGAFEALFSTLALFIDRYVLDIGQLKMAMEAAALAKQPLHQFVALDKAFASPFWPVAFDLAFSDALLHAMFSEAATQHARDSYPRYFQSVFERGLRREDAATNPWLHHALFGFFIDRREAWPPIMDTTTGGPPLPQSCCPIDQVPSFAPFAALSLSNLFDWMSEAEGRAVVERLGDELHAGAKVIVRQLNSRAPLQEWFAESFDLDHELAAAFVHEDRSLFYDGAVFAVRKPR